ncbi:unnamed protein product, partial [Phaeothamnion confervicola]
RGGWRRRPGQPRRYRVECTWIEAQVAVEIPASATDAFDLYSQLDQHSRWSPWLREVEFDRASGQSRWVLASRGLRVSWKAVNTLNAPPSDIKWESVTGLQNRGHVSFRTPNKRRSSPSLPAADRGAGPFPPGSEVGPSRCAMTLSLSYNVPAIVTAVLKIKAAEMFVKRTLVRDLQRFSVV